MDELQHYTEQYHSIKELESDALPDEALLKMETLMLLTTYFQIINQLNENTEKIQNNKIDNNVSNQDEFEKFLSSLLNYNKLLVHRDKLRQDQIRLIKRIEERI